MSSNSFNLRVVKSNGIVPDESIKPEELLEMIERDGQADRMDISSRDWANGILPHLDYENQLIAISSLLYRNREAARELDTERTKIEDFIPKSTGSATDRAIDELGEVFHLSIYQDAAHSMAALGMIAPLFESIFFQGFQGIRTNYYGIHVVPAGSARGAVPNADTFWDCHKFWIVAKSRTKTDLVEGIVQLAEAVDLSPYLPAGLHGTLKALFSYRNKMFHNGLEWPPREREKFSRHIQQDGWQDWFSAATSGEQPWIFYMTEQFIQHCLQMIDKVLDSLGAYSANQEPIASIPVERS